MNKVTITINNVSLTATISDTAAGKDFLSRLPKDFKLKDIEGFDEKVSDLDYSPNTEDMDYEEEIIAGDIAYYNPKDLPDCTLVLYAGAKGKWPGIFNIGHFDTEDYKKVLLPKNSSLVAKVKKA